MHPRTIATFDQLQKAKWFSNVGTRDTRDAVVLASWEEAIEHCSSVYWENICLEASNQYRQRVLERSESRYRQWNQVIEMLKPSTMPLVQRKIEIVVREHALPKVFEDTVQWDILGIATEAEFADVYPAGFYASQGYWYINGHFPCGWIGDFPKGQLIVY